MQNDNPIQNYEQIRARNALEAATDKNKYDFAGRDDGKAVAKDVPEQIRRDGLLGALAFACETKKDDKTKQEKLKNPGHNAVFRAIIAHLPDVRADFGMTMGTPAELLKSLAGPDVSADVLRAVTTESLAYLNYLRRFAHGDKEAENV